GNAFHGLYSASAETPTLQSNNLDDRLRSQGLTAVQPVKTLRLCLRRAARHQLQQEALQPATFTWHDLNGDKLYQPGEVNLNLNGFDFVSVNGAIGNVMNPNLKQPLYSESATSYEHELAPSVGFNTSYVYRRSTDNYNIPDRTWRVPSARTTFRSRAETPERTGSSAPPTTVGASRSSTIRRRIGAWPLCRTSCRTARSPTNSTRWSSP